MPPHAEIRKRIRPEPTAQRHAEKPLFEFDIMTEQLRAEMKQTVYEHGFVLGIAQPKYKPKLPGIATDIAKKPWKKIIANKWLPMHPIKLGGEIISTKKGGLWKLGRDKRNAAKIRKLNEKYAPEVEAMAREYEAEVKAALQELADAVAAGRVNNGNRNEYFKNYKNKVRGAKTKFQQTAHAITEKYGKEFKGKWV